MCDLARLWRLVFLLLAILISACQTSQLKLQSERAWLIQPAKTYPLKIRGEVKISSEEGFGFKGMAELEADLNLKTERSGNSLIKLDLELLSYQLKTDSSLKALSRSVDSFLKNQLKNFKPSFWLDPVTGEILSFKHNSEAQRLDSRASELMALFFFPRLIPGGDFEYSIAKPWEVKISHHERRISFTDHQSGVTTRLSLFSPETPEAVGRLLVNQNYRANYDEDLIIVIEADLVTRTPIKKSGLNLVIPLKINLSGRLDYGFNSGD